MIKKPNPTDVHVGSRIKMRRLMIHISQGKLANSLGVSFQQVQKYEQGTNRVSASRLQQMAKALTVPVSFFFEGIDTTKGAESKSPAFVSDFWTTPYGLELAEHYSGLTNQNRRVVADVARALYQAGH